MNRGMTLYDHHEEAYHVCRAHREEDCEVCFPREYADTCAGCGLEIDDEEHPAKTSKGVMCRSCYVEHLEDENRNLRLGLQLVSSFLVKEAEAIDKALAEFDKADHYDPMNLGAFLGTVIHEVGTMKFYVEQERKVV